MASDGVRLFFTLLDPRKDWGNLCRALEHPEWIDDPRFATPKLRTENSGLLIPMIDDLVSQKDSAEWKRIFAIHEVIWAPVPDSCQVPDDAQMAANGVFVDIEGSALKTVSNPLTVEGAQKTTPKMAPAVGQHNDEILRELGYDDAQIAALRAAGVM